MNTLNGDLTAEKLLPLIAAAEIGAEYFCIDAGWYDDSGYWWDGVGAWEASTVRFPEGLPPVIARIVDRGLVPGLWLEPEVVGVRSAVAATLPAEAFIARRGVRVEQNGRYLLDLRSRAAQKHLDGVVDRLIRDHHVGFFKFDYNTTIDAGPDDEGVSAGEGLLAHNRALLAWVDRLRTRHPDLVLENCASGAMRMDYAMLARFDLQSTSDQQDAIRYAPIAAAAPMSMTPEQAANWAYPQPGMTQERSTFALVNAMLGTMYLSGYLNRMSEGERALVSEAVEVNKALRAEIEASTPFWPLGLPDWDASQLALALKTERSTLVALWDRSESPTRFEVPFPAARGREVSIDSVFPTVDSWNYDWNSDHGVLTVSASSAEPSARVIRLG